MKAPPALWAVAAMLLLATAAAAVEPPPWICECHHALWREYFDPASVSLIISMAVQLSGSAADFGPDQQDAFVDVVANAANVDSYRVEITSVADVEVSARRRLLAAGVQVDFTIRVPDADEKLAPPILEALTMDKMQAGLAAQGLPTMIAVVKKAKMMRTFTGGKSVTLHENTGLCGGGIDDELDGPDGLPWTWSACWTACLDKYADALTAIDGPQNGLCYCQDACTHTYDCGVIPQ